MVPAGVPAGPEGCWAVLLPVPIQPGSEREGSLGAGISAAICPSREMRLESGPREPSTQLLIEGAGRSAL